MSWTKRELIAQAFGKIGLASYAFDLSAEQLQSALRDLDSMMAYWNSMGIRLGYPSPSTAGGSRLAESAGVSDVVIEAITTNLAMRLAWTLGKTVPAELRVAARQTYDVLLARAVVPIRAQLPSGTPAGAGNRIWRGVDDPFLDEPDVPLDAGPDSELDFK